VEFHGDHESGKPVIIDRFSWLQKSSELKNNLMNSYLITSILGTERIIKLRPDF